MDKCSAAIKTASTVMVLPDSVVECDDVSA